MDYCFVRSDDETETVTILLMKIVTLEPFRLGLLSERAQISTPPMSHSAPWWDCATLDTAGALIKTDSEPVILSFREEMMRRLEVGAIPVESASHESESNGSVENGVKLCQGMLRVHSLALERKLKGNIPSQHPVMTWLVECVADIVTKYMLGVDGRTCYERLFDK